jgi:acetyl/propionyl-CoA carboxylase alpha subunit
VEHPVTELTTGIDLVEQQIRIARNEELQLTQEDIGIEGHAIELRVYAENPYDNFLPDIGKLEMYRPPQADYIRVDDGFDEGMNVPIHYDPMLSKLIVYGSNRMQAIARMKFAIDHYQIQGVTTTLPFGRYVMDHPSFVDGSYDTQFVNHYFDAETLKEHEKEDMQVAAVAGLKLLLKEWDKVKLPQDQDD